MRNIIIFQDYYPLQKLTQILKICVNYNIIFRLLQLTPSIPDGYPTVSLNKFHKV